MKPCGKKTCEETAVFVCILAGKRVNVCAEHLPELAEHMLKSGHGAVLLDLAPEA